MVVENVPTLLTLWMPSEPRAHKNSAHPLTSTQRVKGVSKGHASLIQRDPDKVKKSAQEEQADLARLQGSAAARRPAGASGPGAQAASSPAGELKRARAAPALASGATGAARQVASGRLARPAGARRPRGSPRWPG